MDTLFVTAEQAAMGHKDHYSRKPTAHILLVERGVTVIATSNIASLEARTLAGRAARWGAASVLLVQEGLSQDKARKLIDKALK